MGLSPENQIAPRYPNSGRPEVGIAISVEDQQLRFQALKKEMQIHDGEFVLMVVRHWEKLAFDIPEEQTPYSLDKDYYLGLISSPFIQIENSQIGIGTIQHVHFDEKRPELEVTIGEGILNPWKAWDYDLDRDSLAYPQSHPFEKNSKLVEIIVGDQNVADWVTSEVKVGRVPDELLRLMDEPPRFLEKNMDRYFNKDLLVAFLGMAKSLSRDLNLPEELVNNSGEELK